MDDSRVADDSSVHGYPIAHCPATCRRKAIRPQRGGRPPVIFRPSLHGLAHEVAAAEEPTRGPSANPRANPAALSSYNSQAATADAASCFHRPAGVSMEVSCDIEPLCLGRRKLMIISRLGVSIVFFDCCCAGSTIHALHGNHRGKGWVGGSQRLLWIDVCKLMERFLV